MFENKDRHKPKDQVSSQIHKAWTPLWLSDERLTLCKCLEKRSSLHWDGIK